MSILTEQSAATQVFNLPRVNLLPPEIEAGRRFRRVQLGLGVGAVAALGVVGLLVIVANSQVSGAQDDLTSAKAQQSALQAKVATYAEVPAIYAKVDAAEAQLSLAMGQEVRWSYFMNDLSLSVPRKVSLTSMTVTQNVDAAATGVSSTTPGYLAPGVATVTFSGQGYVHNDVAAWLDALAKQRGITQPYFTTSTKTPVGSQDSVTFTSQATVTQDALSKRWTQKAGS